jgi:acetolactate synthase-1/2/3 large subunit
VNGARSLLDTLLASGLDTCFANPGTSEMHFVAALDQAPGMRCVLGLHETIVTGMADGYWRIAGNPACTLLHCGPGLANGLTNLHNARRARSGIVNIVGDQATYHRPHDPPLTADTEAMARTVSAWVRTTMAAKDVGRDAAEAIRAARTLPGQVATLILPSDASWDEGGVAADPLPVPDAPAIEAKAVEAAGCALRDHGPRTLILVGGRAALAKPLELAWRLAATSGAGLLAEFGVAHVARGRGRVPVERVPYGTDQANETLAKYEHIVLVNARPPVGFFAYPGKRGTHYAPDAKLHVLSRLDQDPAVALSALAEALHAPAGAIPNPGPRPDVPRGTPTPEGLAQAVAAVLPEGAIVSDESVSFGRNFYRGTHAAAPHDWLHLAGGAIGDGLPVATGAAIASKGARRVLSLQADGSAMYSLQALWTQARERLPCTTVILSNRKYAILLGEYKGVGATPGANAHAMMDLEDPALDWVRLANGMGVEAARATTLEQCADLMLQSFRQPGPFLVELAI